MKQLSGALPKTIPLLMPKLRCFTFACRGGVPHPESARRDLNDILRQRKACLHWSYVGRNGPAAVWAGGEIEFGPVFQVGGDFADFADFAGMPFGPGGGMGGPPDDEALMDFMLGGQQEWPIPNFVM